MKYDLVGYLLGALEVAEQQEIEEALQDDSRLRQQLEVLVLRLQPLESCRHVEPPAGLSDRTCELVAESAEPATLRERVFSSRGGNWSGRSRWSIMDTVLLPAWSWSWPCYFFPRF